MPRRKLTQKTIAKLKAPTASGKPELHWDTDLRGFGVLCSGVTNSRTYICQRDLPGGQTRRLKIAATNEVTFAEAKETARGKLVDMRRGLDPKRKTTGTLAQTLEAYLLANKEIKPQTAAIYSRVVNTHLAPWRDRPLASITPLEVDALHHAIAARVSKHTGGEQSGHSAANNAVRLLKLLYNFAASRDDSLPRNPVRLRESEWHEVKPKRNPIALERLGEWYAAVNALPPLGRDYLLLTLYTGMRRREVSGLTWEGEIDFNKRLIKLPAARAKTGRALDLPMTDFVHNLLVARRSLGDAKYVFPSYGRSGHIEEVRTWLETVRETTGIKFSTHDLRRTFVTVAESVDISHYALKALVNHALGGSNTERYIGMTPDRLREPAQLVTDKLKQLCGISDPAGAVKLRIG